MKRAVAETAAAVALVAALIGTGIELVAVKHEWRSLFQERELLRAEEDRLQDEWSALWIEVHTLAGHARIDEIARDELGMVEPDEFGFARPGHFYRLSGGLQRRVATENEIFHCRRLERHRVRVIHSPDHRFFAVPSNGSKFHPGLLSRRWCV